MPRLRFVQRARKRSGAMRLFRPRLIYCEERLAPATSAFSSGTWTLSFTATGTTAESVTMFNFGSTTQLSGNFTGTSSVATASISKIIVQDTGGGTSQSFSYLGDTMTLSSGFSCTGVEAVLINGPVKVTGTSTFVITAPKSISIQDSITSVSGEITLKANTQATPMASFYLQVTKNISSTSGNITIDGKGGSNGGTGVLISQCTVGLGTTGKISITGTAGLSSANKTGGVELLQATVTSGGGNVTVTGVSAATGSASINVGVYVDGKITAGGAGSVTVNGTGGAGGGDANYGVFVYNGSSIESSGGPVSVTGLAGGSGTSSFNVGVNVDGQIKAGGNGSVTVNGTGGSAVGDDNYGIIVNFSRLISSFGGPVSVTGTGGGSSTSAHNYGISNQGTISAGGTGTLTINGTGGATSGGSDLGIFNANLITSGGGNVSITGKGGGTGSSSSNIGIDNNATIAVGGSGSVSVNGTGGATTATDNYGIYDTATITSVNGAVSLTGTRGNALSDGVRIEGGTISTGGTGALTFTSTGSTSLSFTTLTPGGSMTMNSTGPITVPSDCTIQVGGPLTVSASGQAATFDVYGNIATQLVISTGTTVLVNGSFDAPCPVQVNGTLGGVGYLDVVTVLSGGKLAPGNGPGTINTGNTVLNSGSIYSIELNGTSAQVDYDQHSVFGTLNLGGATLQGTLGFTPAMGQQFLIIGNDGGDTVTGTFNGLIEGAAANIGGLYFAVSYKGGDGNDVRLTRVAPPAPTVTSVVLDNGPGAAGLNSTQRSEVRRIIVSFSEAVNFTPNVVSAFGLSRSGTSSSPGTTGAVGLVANPAAGPASSVTITFTGTFADATNSLVDGIYNFSITATKVSGTGGQLNGSGGGANTNYSVTGTTANKWFRYYGDQNADGTVDQTDYLVFRNALAGGPSSVFDYQNSGDVDQTDYLEFRNRLAGAP
ncbi:MAG: beta strand repeat-containing protein [Gemmataceae bacterium]